MDLFKLLLPGAVHRILGNEVEVFGRSEFRKDWDTWLLFEFDRNNLTVGVFRLRRRFPSRDFANKICFSVGGAWSQVSQAGGPVEDREGDLRAELFGSEWVVQADRIS